jgi:hypothetical protein
MKSDNFDNLEAFNLAEPVLASFAKTKDSISIIQRGLSPEERGLPEVWNWFLQTVAKQDIEEYYRLLEPLIATASAAYDYRGCKVTFKLRSKSASEHPHAEEPLSLNIRADIPDVGGLLLFYDTTEKLKALDCGKQLYPQMNSWIAANLISKRAQNVRKSFESKKIPTLIERNFARYDFSLFCNNESWGKIFAESADLKNIIPLIPELTNIAIGTSIETSDPAPGLHISSEGKMKRMAIYEDIARLTETCLDIVILTAAQ